MKIEIFCRTQKVFFRQKSILDPFQFIVSFEVPNTTLNVFVSTLMMQTPSEVGNISGQTNQLKEPSDVTSTVDFSKGVEGSSKMETPSTEGKLKKAFKAMRILKVNDL